MYSSSNSDDDNDSADCNMSSYLHSAYSERYNEFHEDETFENKIVEHTIETDTRVPTLGLMLVGQGESNGSTENSKMLNEFILS